MRPRPHRPAVLLIALLTIASACSTRRDPIRIEEGSLIVENQTAGEWRTVVITVNDHFRGGAPVLAAGSRLAAPLREFHTAFGQPFDRGRMSVTKVEVTATDAAGQPVMLKWNGLRKPN